MDVKSAFLYGKIEEEVYVCQPLGFEDPDFPDRVYKVEKALYGLHQAPRAWYETLSTYLLDNEFQRGKIDKTLFIKRHKDDVPWENLHLLGITSAIRKVKTASTPMETQKPLLKDEDGEEVDVHMYRSMIGSLMYLTSSRPDIMFAVCACARYQVNPKVSHLHVVKRIFRLTYYGWFYYGWGEINAVRFVYSHGQKFNGKNVSMPWKPKRKDTPVPHPSDPIENVADEAVHKELGDSLVRAATTASSLEAERDNESSDNKESLGEDASKQGRIDAIDADEEITLVSVQNIDEEIFDVNVLDGEEVFVTEQKFYAAGNVVCTASDATTVSAATTTTDNDGDITLAQALIEMKSIKPKVKGAVIQELGKSTPIISSQQSHDKGKGILIEPVKKKDQILLDEETALNLQAEFDKEERLAREKAEKEKEVNIALIETWDDIQEKIDADHQLAERMKAQEQEELSIEEKATLF
ncbi:retrovirus-related pol polyprotein from transposon TNT 1-94 [Tanacetum coccineum]